MPGTVPALKAWTVTENRPRPLVLSSAEEWPSQTGYANPNLPFLSFHRVFKKASPNGKVSV